MSGKFFNRDKLSPPPAENAKKSRVLNADHLVEERINLFAMMMCDIGLLSHNRISDWQPIPDNAFESITKRNKTFCERRLNYQVFCVPYRVPKAKISLDLSIYISVKLLLFMVPTEGFEPPTY